ncbi:serine-rich adhesin for platelets [Eurosta solidaginis]|uniref:serine-rich adhesin for platelets n=1 Tax=Eurosta solidaginis TaxID=178769 RepID=UPI0035315005
MGCASSTPMVATAGSEILKAATHVASDAAKGAENAVGEVADTVGKTLESTKDSVSTAVTGIAHDLSNAFTEKTNELDTVKNELLERWHLGGGADATTLEQTTETSTNHLDTKALEAGARLPTPPPNLDSLKISATAPEIEHAMVQSLEETPPSANATIADLEKLTTDVRQIAQTNVKDLAALAAEPSAMAVTAGIEGVEHVMIGSTATAEPAVDLITLLAAEKRPSTTEWEKHADNLSRTRRLNAFKGGGKFRHFGPAAPQIQSIHPANYILPIEEKEATQRVGNIMKRTIKNSLLENDSNFSDVYYNSRSSSPYSTSSNSPLLRRRRPRLPNHSVLAMNAKHMQRELAALLSDRRSAARSLTVLPTPVRQFDYNPHRVRYASPTLTPTPPMVLQTDVPPLTHIVNWKRNREHASLSSIPVHMGRGLETSTYLATSPLNNVISQSKIKPTKAFAPLRGQTINARSRIFGQTRTGSPINRRVFARRPNLAQANKTRFIPTQTNSPERTKALIQNKIEMAKKSEKQLAQSPTITMLEREASIRVEKAASISEMVANGFSLSRALSPIKLAAESYSIPHLNSVVSKSGRSTPHSLLEVVEQAVERTKTGGSTTTEGGEEVVFGEIGKRNQKVNKATNEEKQESKRCGETMKSGNIAEATSSKSNSRVIKGAEGKIEQPVDKTNKPAPRENQTVKSTAAVGRSKTDTPNFNRNSSENQSPTNRNFATKERFSPSSYKNVNLNNVVEDSKPSSWRYSGSGGRDQSSSRSKASENIFRTTPHAQYKRGNFQKNQARKNSEKGKSTSSNWKSSSGENDEVKYTNISNRFEPISSKEALPSLELQSHPGTTELEQDDSTNASSEVSNDSDLSQTNAYHISKKAIYSTESTEEYETKSSSNYHQKNEEGWEYEHQNHIHNIDENLSRASKRLVRANQSKNAKNNSQQSPQNKAANTVTKTGPKSKAHKNSQVSNSLNSSPSKSSKSSNSIVIGMIASTPETEDYNEVEVPNRLNVEFKEAYETIQEMIQSTTETDDYNEIAASNRYVDNFKTRHKTTDETLLSTTETDEFNETEPTQLLHEQLRTQHVTTKATLLLKIESTEVSSEDATRNRLNERYAETTDNTNIYQTSNEEENTQTEADDVSTEPPTFNSSTEVENISTESPSTDFEEPTQNKMTLYPPDANENNIIYAATSLEDLLQLLPPQTAYLKLGRSATMMALRSSTPLLDPQSISYRSTPQRRYKRHSVCDGCHDDRVPIVTELSSVALSRSPLVPPSPVKMRDRCAGCYNKYVIK